MKKYITDDIKLFHARMEDLIPTLDHVHHIFTDPPYLYIKTHAFDKKFDEQLLFENAKRILPDNGFIALFGRGTSFYRWNTRLAELGFIFKEEIVWDKRRISSPCAPLKRVHETVSINTKKNGKIKKTKIQYIEQNKFNYEKIENDIKRIITTLNNEKGLKEVLEYIETGKALYKYTKSNHGLTIVTPKSKDVAINRLSAIANGLTEKSIIEICSSRNNTLHPTEKPVRLAERIIALISDPGDTIYDPFMGSGAFGVACLRTGRKYIGSEMIEEYFDIACRRLREVLT